MTDHSPRESEPLSISNARFRVNPYTNINRNGLFTLQREPQRTPAQQPYLQLSRSSATAFHQQCPTTTEQAPPSHLRPHQFRVRYTTPGIVEREHARICRACTEDRPVQRDYPRGSEFRTLRVIHAEGRATARKDPARTGGARSRGES